MKYWTGLVEESGIEVDTLDVCDERVIDRKFTVNLDFRRMRPITSELNIYTDGSKIDQRVGAGYVMYHFRSRIREEKFNLPEYATVFQAELLAIREAAIGLKQMGEFRYVRILVDSQAALHSLILRRVESRLVMETITALNEAAEGRTIILNWTMAHVGTTGNEYADELAKAGAIGENRLSVGVPRVEIKNRINTFIYSKWQAEFNAYDKARMGKSFYHGPDSCKAKYVLKLSRAHLARFIRIISGHNSLFYFRSKVDSEISPICRFCNEEDETFLHLVNDCPRFLLDRRDKFLDQLICNDHMWSVQTLLDFSFLPGINDALEGDTRIELYRHHQDESFDLSGGGSESSSTSFEGENF